MSVITLPASFAPRSVQLTLSTNQRVAASPFGGSEQAIDLMNDRWLMSFELPNCTRANAYQREAFIGAMRGQVNTVNLWHFSHPRPRGTVRGSLTLGANAAQGANSIVVSGCSPSNGTLLMGDMLGVGGLLVMVASDCTASGGSVTVPLTNRLRTAKTSGTAVVWDKPTASFRLLSTSGVTFESGISTTASFEFGEAIA